MDPAPDLSRLTLAEAARMVADKKLPPVDQWNPEHCGDSEMRIARDGTWFHQGSPIGRTAMVRLFSTVLRREPDGRHVLVTPVEKLDIDVEDAAFVALEMKSDGAGKDRTVAFRLNTGDLVVADAQHGVTVRESADGPRPYVAVRGGLEALINRNVYYELVSLALEEGAKPVGVWSNGSFLSLEPTA